MENRNLLNDEWLKDTVFEMGQMLTCRFKGDSNHNDETPISPALLSKILLVNVTNV